MRSSGILFLLYIPSFVYHLEDNIYLYVVIKTVIIDYRQSPDFLLFIRLSLCGKRSKRDCSVMTFLLIIPENIISCATTMFLIAVTICPPAGHSQKFSSYFPRKPFSNLMKLYLCLQMSIGCLVDGIFSRRHTMKSLSP